MMMHLIVENQRLVTIGDNPPNNNSPPNIASDEEIILKISFDTADSLCVDCECFNNEISISIDNKQFPITESP